jgi:hypothetical protein
MIAIDSQSLDNMPQIPVASILSASFKQCLAIWPNKAQRSYMRKQTCAELIYAEFSLGGGIEALR